MRPLEGHLDGVRLTLHVDQLTTRTHVPPLALEPVAIRIRRIGFLHVEVLLIDAKNGEAPGHPIIVADGYAGHAGFGGSDRVPSRRTEVDNVAKGRVHHITMRVVGQERFAGRRLFAGNDPVVARTWTFICGEGESRIHGLGGGLGGGRAVSLARHGKPIVVGIARDVEDAGLDVVEIEAVRNDELAFGFGRLEFPRLGKTQAFHVQRTRHFARCIPGHGPARHTGEDGLGGPDRLGRETHKVELDGDLLLVDRLLDRGVHALGERIENQLSLGVILPKLGVPVAAELKHPREGVALDIVLPKNLGEATLAIAAPHLQLPHTILSNHEALGEEKISGVLRVDVGNPELVTDDFDRRLGARDHDRPVDLGKRRFRGGRRVGRGRALSRNIARREDGKEKSRNNRRSHAPEFLTRNPSRGDNAVVI